MKRAILRGPFLTQSGYGTHARQVAQWAMSKPDLDVRFQLLQWGNTPWFVDSNAMDGLIGEIMRRSTTIENETYDVSLQVQLPNEWDTKLAPVNIGITAGVETDRCNPAWVQACNTMTKLIVPSSHVVSSIRASGELTVPVDVVPESYVSQCSLSAEKLPIDQLPDFSTPTNFLIFGQITGNNPHNDRKNTFFALKWLMEEFKDDPNVGIILKTNAGRNTRIDRVGVMGMVTQVIREVRKGQFPRVHVLHGEMSDLEIAALYKHPKVLALVAPTRGEGYGLPILEAAASGLPIVATGWSGHVDFLKHGKYVSLYYALEEVHRSRIDDNIFMKGARWASVNESDFKKRLRKLYTSPAIPREWASELQKKILELYSFDAVARRYDEALGSYL